jgi:hypothetical protein
MPSRNCSSRGVVEQQQMAVAGQLGSCLEPNRTWQGYASGPLSTLSKNGRAENQLYAYYRRWLQWR